MRKRTAKIPSLILVTLFVGLTVALEHTAGQPSRKNPIVSADDFQSVVSNLDFKLIEDHIKNLVNFQSRVPGYPGNVLARQYIINYLNSCGLSDIQVQTFKVAVPIDFETSLSVTSPERSVNSIKIYGFWPNLVATTRTPPEGITGKLTFIEDDDFDGKEIENHILLMHFNTGENWLTGAKLGAKAVLFIEPINTTRAEARSKFLSDVSFYFPRFYILKEDALSLQGLLETSDVQVQINSNMTWREVETANILGFVGGTQYPNKYVVVSAYYDSHSVVPSVAPGAQEASGIASMLELVRFYADNPPKHSVIFAALSAHNLGLAGARYFVKRNIMENWDEFGKKIVLWINLDLSSEGTSIAPIISGYMYFLTYAQGIYKGLQKLSTHIFNIKKQIELQLGKTFDVLDEGMTEWVYWPEVSSSSIIPLDSEPAVLLGVPAFSFITAKVSRNAWQTPLDVFGGVQIENLRTQLEFISSCIFAILNLDNLQPEYVSRWERGGMWSDFTGMIAEYNETAGWYSPIPKALVCVRKAYALSYLADSGMWIFDFTDEEGKVFIPGIAQSSGLTPWELRAYVLNENTGGVEYAPDFGKYKYSAEMLDVKGSYFDFGYFSLFRCGSLVLFDLGDPETLNEPIDHSFSISVNSFDTHAPPASWGVEYRFTRFGHSTAVVYAPPDTRVEVLTHASYATKHPLAVLLNASKEQPEGYGYKVEAGQQLAMSYTAFHYAENFYWVTENRLADVSNYGIQVSDPEIHVQTAQYLEEARDALTKRNYRLAYSHIVKAWSMERKIYRDTRRVEDDAINATLFFSILLIPFIIIAEKLFFDLKGTKEILMIVILFAAMTALFSFLHPGFALAADPLTILTGFSILVLIIPVFLALFNVLLKFLKEIRRKHLGAFVEVSRIGEITAIFSVAVRYMKRRRLRTGLVLISIILFTAALVLFSSISPISLEHPIYVSSTGPYSGILIKYPEWGRMEIELSSEIINFVSSRYSSALVVPRAWLYTKVSPSGLYFTLKTNEGEARILGVGGVTAYETDLLPELNSSLTKGKWFEPESSGQCIISEETASKLKISDIPAKLYFEGVELTVIGIINAQKMDQIRDLDSESSIIPLLITPLSWSTHLKAFETIWISYEDAVKFGARTMSLAIRFDDTDLIEPAALELYNLFNLEVYRSIYGETVLYTRGIALVAFGWTHVLILSFIALFSVLNMMLASIHERLREIGIFSAVGLSPMSITIIFLFEAVILGITGATIGYIAAMGISKAASAFLPFLNYSSSQVIITVAFTILVTVISTIYPMFKTAKLVTPSLERKWKIPTRPGERDWKIPMPFTVNAKDLAGILALIVEYFDLHRGETTEVFNVSEVKLKEKRERLIYELEARVSLAPYESGLKQVIRLQATKDEEKNMFYFEINIHRTHGTRSDWEMLNRPFLDNLRKRFLLWTSLKADERRKYIAEFRSLKIERE